MSNEICKYYQKDFVPGIPGVSFGKNPGRCNGRGCEHVVNQETEVDGVMRVVPVCGVDGKAEYSPAEVVSGGGLIDVLAGVFFS